MKLCFVVPRYGVEVIGGAESGARMLSEHLVAERGWEVEVITTCARDHQSWDNVYLAGDSLVNGVVVRRFPVVRGRAPGFDLLSRVVQVGVEGDHIGCALGCRIDNVRAHRTLELDPFPRLLHGDPRGPRL